LVQDAPLTVNLLPLAPVEAQAFDALVATFSDPCPGPAADYTASVDFGNGYDVPGSIAANGNGSFNIRAQGYYADDGAYPVTVVVRDKGGAWAKATRTAQVADAPLTVRALNVLPVYDGVPFTAPVAVFHEGGLDSAGDFTVTVNWGDGTPPVTGTV